MYPRPRLDGRERLWPRCGSRAETRTPQGDDFQVNFYTTLDQWYPTVAVAPDGEFVVVWDSTGSAGTDQGSWSIQGRRFFLGIFTDGFESGETTAWSSTVP